MTPSPSSLAQQIAASPPVLDPSRILKRRRNSSSSESSSSTVKLVPTDKPPKKPPAARARGPKKEQVKRVKKRSRLTGLPIGISVEQRRAIGAVDTPMEDSTSLSNSEACQRIIFDV